MAQTTARWNPETTDWNKNPHPAIGDWGFDRLGYPKGLYIHGITVKEGRKVRNAVIYDNDVFDDVFEDEWMFAMASLGKMNLKALIVTWLPGIFTRAEIRELRGPGTEGLHVTGFDEECEARVKSFTMSVLLNRKAYGLHHHSPTTNKPKYNYL